MGWCLEVWGNYACFTRPEMKVERVSYDVITPSAARAIYEAILWKPAISWNITTIEVMNPIKWLSVRRNEVGKKASVPGLKELSGEKEPSAGLFIEDERQQRAGLLLRDVRYRIYAFFDFIPPAQRKKNLPTETALWADASEEAESTRADECPAKYAAMFERRAKKGQCFHRPYLGCREFACNFQLVGQDVDRKPIQESRDLGWMLYDMDFSDMENPHALFFRAKLDGGAIRVPKKDSEEVLS
jgi:CRISPR-associated protein Cas5d